MTKRRGLGKGLSALIPESNMPLDTAGLKTIEVTAIAPNPHQPRSHMDEEKNILYLPNCGGMCSWFAGRSDKARDNLGNIELRPSVRPGGGAITYFTAAPGPVTLARLYRVSGKYRMAIVPGEVVNLSDNDKSAFIAARGKHQLPTAFVQVEANLERFVDEFGSNHISGVGGQWVRELVALCELIDVEPVVMDNSF